MTDNTSWGAAEIENVFGFHAATLEGPNATAPKHMEVRVNFREFMEYLDRTLVPGRAKSLVFTEMQKASMFSHFAIAETAPIKDEHTVSRLISEETPLDVRERENPDYDKF